MNLYVYIYTIQRLLDHAKSFVLWLRLVFSCCCSFVGFNCCNFCNCTNCNLQPSYQARDFSQVPHYLFLENAGLGSLCCYPVLLSFINQAPALG